jgi:AcrR family transcriptional regulator
MPPRAHKPFHRGLDRERVLRAALAVLDEEGPERLTMRRVAGRLDVEAASLYSHVASKGDLVDGVLDLVLDAVPMPDPGPDWRAELIAIYGAYRATLLAHPGAVPLLTQRSRTSHSQTRLVGRAIELLEAGGLGIDDAALAQVTVVAFALGFVTQEVGAPATLPEDVLAQSPIFQRAIPALLRHTVDERFLRGMDTILDGISLHTHGA